MFNRIRWQLVGWNVLVLSVILFLLGSGVYLLFRYSLYRGVDETLVLRGERLIRGEAFRELLRLTGTTLRPVPNQITPSVAPVIPLSPVEAEGLFYLLLDSQGRVLANPQSVALDYLPDLNAVAVMSVTRADLRTVNVGSGNKVRLYTTRLGDAARPIVILQVGHPLAPQETALRGLLILLVSGGLTGVFLSAVGGFFLAERALVPIRNAFRRQHEFVADASHELRTPLTLIRANTEMLTRHPELPVAANLDCLNDVLRETDHLNRLVNDLLTLARADAGADVLEWEQVALDQLCQEASRQFAPLAAAHNVTLEVNTPSPCVLRGDPGRLRQLLLILLDNAIKYNRPGGQATLSLRVERGQAILTVSDTGMGIAPEHLPHLFERFYRVDKARSREMGGVGLGLSIAHWIVTAHRGRIQVSSVPDQGSIFTIFLPIQ